MNKLPSLPKKITSHTAILDRKPGEVFVSTAFMAVFVNGSQKCITRQEWVDERLIRACDLGGHCHGSNECSLYWKDWSDMPTLGIWGRDYHKLKSGN